jgi:DNA-binding NarL/FixJ family response regulator
MFLLPPFLRRLFRKDQETDDDFHIYFSDQALVVTIRKLAQEQGRSEEEVLTEFAKAGQDLFFNQDTLAACWDSLSAREQEVLALVCLGHRNYEIAEVLSLSHQTVKTHLQNIFNKFDMRSTRELRRALQGWQFREWWDARHP